MRAFGAEVRSLLRDFSLRQKRRYCIKTGRRMASKTQKQKVHLFEVGRRYLRKVKVDYGTHDEVIFIKGRSACFVEFKRWGKTERRKVKVTDDGVEYVALGSYFNAPTFTRAALWLRLTQKGRRAK